MCSANSTSGIMSMSAATTRSARAMRTLTRRKVNPSITSNTGPKTTRGMPMKAMNRPNTCPKTSGPL
jgi:hypothetical protein